MLVAGFAGAQHSPAQSTVRSETKTIFRDSDGNVISNNEFVDIRMANFHYPDGTVVRTLGDGSTEFRLQKIPQEGMMVPEFTVLTINGKKISSADLKGKVVVLNFWFIGCPVCLAHKPGLNDLKAKFGQTEDLVFLALTRDPAANVKRFLAKERFDYEQAAEAGSVLDLFKFSGYPKNIVIGRNGEIVYWRSTISAWDKFEAVVRAELAKLEIEGQAHGRIFSFPTASESR